MEIMIKPSLTEKFKKSLVDIIENNDCVLPDETTINLFSKKFNCRSPQQLDQLILIEEKKYLDFILDLIRNRENIFVSFEVLNSIKYYSKYLDRCINYFRHKRLKKVKDRVFLIQKIMGNIDKIVNVLSNYVSDKSEINVGLYSLIKKSLEILDKEKKLKQVSEKSGKTFHNLTKTDESIVALAFYKAIYDNKNPVIISNDKDLFRLTIKGYNLFLYSGFNNFILNNLEKTVIKMYDLFNKDYVYRECLDSREIIAEKIKLSDEARESIEHNTTLIRKYSLNTR